MLLKYLEEFRSALDRYPTPGMCLLGDNVDHKVVIPDVAQSISTLRSKIAELDLVLENSNDLLAGYLQHIQPDEEPAASEEPEEETSQVKTQEETVNETAEETV